MLPASFLILFRTVKQQHLLEILCVETMLRSSVDLQNISMPVKSRAQKHQLYTHAYYTCHHLSGIFKISHLSCVA